MTLIANFIVTSQAVAGLVRVNRRKLGNCPVSVTVCYIIKSKFYRS